MSTILVVEDDEAIAKDVQRTLIRLGYRVPATASSADEAVQLVEKAQPDLVLMDIKLRGKRDGIEATAIIRSRWDVPVIFLTSYADELTLSRARETGPHGFLLKPFSERELRTAIEVALRKHDVEVKLAERERWFSTTLQSIGDAVIATDARECITFMNDTAEQLTGWRRQDALGRHLGEVFRLVEENGDAPADGIARRSRFCVELPENLRLLTREGRRHDVDDQTSPIIDDRGKVLGGLVVFRDMTERRKLEQRLALSERMASIGTMAAGVAHEINNPLTAVVGNVSFARERIKHLMQWLPASSGGSAAMMTEFQELNDCLADAEDAALRVRQVVQNLRKFTSADLGREVLDLPDVLDAALKMAQNHIRHHATLVRAYGTTPFVEANEGRLVQVFTNLLLNAAQAKKEGESTGHEVRVSTRTDSAGRAVVSIQDTGEGIAPALLAKIFEPFFTTKSEGTGVGLGLSISRDIVAALGGEISVDSKLGVGTTFHVALVPAPSVPEKLALALVESAPKRRGKVLVIDDEESVGRAVQRVLGEFHDVVFEVDGRTALARFAKGESFDVIFCDLMMPGMTGVDVYRALACSHPELERRIVFLTGGVFSERAAHFLKEVATLTVPKPFTASSLRAITADYVK